MISFKNFNEILKSLEEGYAKIQGCWFPEFWTRQTEVEKSKAYRKLTRMIDSDMLESFAADDKKRALSLWTILTESMKIITAFPEESEADLERLKELFNDYTKTYYPEEKGVI